MKIEIPGITKESINCRLKEIIYGKYCLRIMTKKEIFTVEKIIKGGLVDSNIIINVDEKFDLIHNCLRLRK